MRELAHFRLPTAAALFLLFFFPRFPSAQTPLGTAFVHQGRLTVSGAPANGLHDFEFSLFDAASGGTQIGSTLTLSDVQVADGLFTIELDFGAGAFGGEKRWLEIGVRDAASGGAFTPLAPRREITPTPQALYAETAGLALVDAVNDADADATNELNSSLNLNGASLEITDAGGTLSADLSPLTNGLGDGHSLDAADGDPRDAVFVDNAGLVGIGTDTPVAGLHVASRGAELGAGTSLEQIGRVQEGVNATALSFVQEFHAVGDRLYAVSSTDDAFSIFDITNPAAPVELSATLDDVTIGLDGANDVFVVGSRAYIVSGTDSALVIFDVSDPVNPVQIGGILDDEATSPGGASELEGAAFVHVVGSLAYVVSTVDNALSVFDISDPASIAELGTIVDNSEGGTATTLNNVQDLYVDGSHAYVASNVPGVLGIFDVSDPANPVELTTVFGNGSTIFTQNLRGVFVANSRVYLAAQNDDALSIVDVSDPSSPVGLGAIRDSASRLLDGARKVYVEGPFAYVSAGLENGISVIDVSDPTNLVEIASIQDNAERQLNSPFANQFVDGRLFVAGFTESAIAILEVENLPLTLLVEGYAAKDTGPLWSVFSDKRLKRDIHPLRDSLGLINRLHPVEFEYSEDWSEAFGRPAPRGAQTGFVAQEYRKVFPADVRRDPHTGYLTVDSSATIPHLVGAVQQLSAENARLREEVHELRELLQQQTE